MKNETNQTFSDVVARLAALNELVIKDYRHFHKSEKLIAQMKLASNMHAHGNTDATAKALACEKLFHSNIRAFFNNAPGFFRRKAQRDLVDKNYHQDIVDEVLKLIAELETRAQSQEEISPEQCIAQHDYMYLVVFQNAYRIQNERDRLYAEDEKNRLLQKRDDIMRQAAEKASRKKEAARIKRQSEAAALAQLAA